MPVEQQQILNSNTVNVAFLESELNQIFGNINVKSFKNFGKY